MATRKSTGDPVTHGGAGDQRAKKEQCVGTCDRGLEEGVAHKRCGTSPLRSLLRAVAAEEITPTAKPFRITVLLLGFGPSFKSSFGAPLTTVSGEDVAENIVVDRLSDYDKSRRSRETQRGRSLPRCFWGTLRADGAFPPYSWPTGCGGNSRTGTPVSSAHSSRF